MLQDRLDALRLPKYLQGDVDDFVRALNAADGEEAIRREGEMQIAFILGVEKAKQLRPADIEALYIIFDDEVQARLRDLPASL
jgi:hypothetical protein